MSHTLERNILKLEEKNPMLGTWLRTLFFLIRKKELPADGTVFDFIRQPENIRKNTELRWRGIFAEEYLVYEGYSQQHPVDYDTPTGKAVADFIQKTFGPGALASVVREGLIVQYFHPETEVKDVWLEKLTADDKTEHWRQYATPPLP